MTDDIRTRIIETMTEVEGLDTVDALTALVIEERAAEATLIAGLIAKAAGEPSRYQITGPEKASRESGLEEAHDIARKRAADLHQSAMDQVEQEPDTTADRLLSDKAVAAGAITLAEVEESGPVEDWHYDVARAVIQAAVLNADEQSVPEEKPVEAWADPEPYANYYDRKDRSRFGNDLPGGLRTYAPRTREQYDADQAVPEEMTIVVDSNRHGQKADG